MKTWQVVIDRVCSGTQKVGIPFWKSWWGGLNMVWAFYALQYNIWFQMLLSISGMLHRFSLKTF